MLLTSAEAGRSSSTTTAATRASAGGGSGAGSGAGSGPGATTTTTTTTSSSSNSKQSLQERLLSRVRKGSEASRSRVESGGAMANDSLDVEVDTLLSRVLAVQAQVGGKGTSGGVGDVLGGDGGDAGGDGNGGDRFMTLRATMLNRLTAVQQLMETTAQQERMAGGNPKEVITAQAQVREGQRQLNEEWRELEGLLRAEKKKKKSKLTPEDLEFREQAVQQIKEEITNIKEVQRQGFVQGYQRPQIASLEESDIMKGDPQARGVATNVPRNMEMTEQHRAQLQQVKDRDQEIDMVVGEIGKGVDDLREIALMQGEEVKRQNVMLEGLESKIDEVHDHVANVNAKMKDTLEEVGRRSDKLCVDIVCLLVLLGMVAVLYRLLKG